MANDVTAAATRPAMKFAYTTPATAPETPGRRSFTTCRDLGVTDASGGWMRAQVTTVKGGMAGPSGWHYHVCEGQFLYVLKGWVEAEFEDGTTLRAEAGHSAFIPGRVIHNELRSSNDFEVLEVCLPADLGTVPCDPPAGRPQR
jgi:quercetin dioxygenase-like cupin family protein